MCVRKLGVWLSLGGFHERGEDWDTKQRIYNSHVIINEQGSVSSCCGGVVCRHTQKPCVCVCVCVYECLCVDTLRSTSTLMRLMMLTAHIVTKANKHTTLTFNKNQHV